MDDGRHFTDYRPNCHLNNLVRTNNNANNSFQYRMFLTHNANNLMDMNRTHACQKNCCGPCQPPYQSGTTMRETRAMVSSSNVAGSGSVACGTKISSDPSIPAHTTEPLSCSQWNVGYANKLQNCCVPTQAAANAYPADRSAAAVKRLSVPGGGVPLTGGDPNFYS